MIHSTQETSIQAPWQWRHGEESWPFTMKVIHAGGQDDSAPDYSTPIPKPGSPIDLKTSTLTTRPYSLDVSMGGGATFQFEGALSTGEWGAIVEQHFKIDIPPFPKKYTHDIMDLWIDMGMKYGSKVGDWNQRSVDELTVTFDVAPVLEQAVGLIRHKFLFGEQLRILAQATGLFKGWGTITLSMRWRMIWVAGMSETISFSDSISVWMQSIGSTVSTYVADEEEVSRSVSPISTPEFDLLFDAVTLKEEAILSADEESADA